MRKIKEAENRIAILTEGRLSIVTAHSEKKINDLTIRRNRCKEESGMILYKDNWCL